MAEESIPGCEKPLWSYESESWIVIETATCSGDATHETLPRKAHRENESWRSRALQTLCMIWTWRLQDLVLALVGLVWPWSSLSNVLIPPFWNGNGYAILWGAGKVLSKHVLLTWAWLGGGPQCLIPMAMVSLPQAQNYGKAFLWVWVWILTVCTGYVWPEDYSPTEISYTLFPWFSHVLWTMPPCLYVIILLPCSAVCNNPASQFNNI